jgi:Flp pilus assembly protein protease CpaA
MPIKQEKIERYGSSQLLSMSHKYVLLININVTYLHCCSPDLRSMRLQNCHKLVLLFSSVFFKVSMSFNSSFRLDLIIGLETCGKSIFPMHLLV